MKLLLENNNSIENTLAAVRACEGMRTRRSVRAFVPRSAALLAALMLGVPGCAGADAADGAGAAESSEAIDEERSLEDVGGDEVQADDVQADDVQADDIESNGAQVDESAPGSGSPGADGDTTPGSREVSDGAESPGVSDLGEVDTAAETPAIAAEPGATLRTSGRQILDSCGNPFVVRGVEQIFGEQLPEGNDWSGLIEQIAASGVNAVRVLAGTDTLGLDDVDRLLQVVADHGMVGYVTPYGDEAMDWLEGQDVRAMLAKHEKYIIIDAFGEPTFDDRARFVRDSKQALQQVRSWGYRVPLTVTANQFGRDLPSLLELGAEIVAADPLGNTILGWQAYWGSGGFYQEHYGMSLNEAVDAVASAPFPIQLGLDRVTDFPSSETADYSTLLTATAARGIGWLWWDWYNPYGNENNLTEDGSATRLTATGDEVVSTHPASIRNTSRLACRVAQ